MERGARGSELTRPARRSRGRPTVARVTDAIALVATAVLSRALSRPHTFANETQKETIATNPTSMYLPSTLPPPSVRSPARLEEALSRNEALVLDLRVRVPHELHHAGLCAEVLELGPSIIDKAEVVGKVASGDGEDEAVL